MAVSYTYNKSLIYGGTDEPNFQVRLIVSDHLILMDMQC
jgi:hypothetical protein